MGTWTNSDGLYIRYGTDEATVTRAGDRSDTTAGMHTTELVINDMTTLTATAAVQANTTVIPSGARIAKVEVLVETPCTGTNAALNIGLARLDRTTELDYDGFVAALAVTSLTPAGFTNTLYEATTGNGALIGTTLAYPGIFTADYDTAAFTAGKIRVLVYWYIPVAAQ